MRTQIQGTCPACDWKGSIFVGEGGYLTCSRGACPNPCAPSEALGVKFPTMASSTPRSDPQALAAPERPLAPDTPNGLTSGPEGYTGGIRPAGEAVRLNTYLDAISTLNNDGDDRHWVKFSTRRVIVEAVMAVADAEHAALWDVIEANGATNSRLMRERDEARAEVGVAWEAHSQVVAQNDELRAALTRVEARCEDADDNRRWLTAFEVRDALKTLYADTPHNDPEFGFDKTAALSDARPASDGCGTGCDECEGKP